MFDNFDSFKSNELTRMHENSEKDRLLNENDEFHKKAGELEKENFILTSLLMDLSKSATKDQSKFVKTNYGVYASNNEMPNLRNIVVAFLSNL